MTETFRLKIVSKRQVTIPQRMLDLLLLSEGDELRVDIEGHKIVGASALKSVPTDLFTPEVLSKLTEREEQLRKGKGISVDAADLLNATQDEMGA